MDSPTNESAAMPQEQPELPVSQPPVLNNTPGRNVAIPPSEGEVADDTTYRHRDEQIQAISALDECCICLSPLADGTSTLMILRCGHKYHAECICVNSIARLDESVPSIMLAITCSMCREGSRLFTHGCAPPPPGCENWN